MSPTEQRGQFLGCRCIYLFKTDRVEIAADYGGAPEPRTDGVNVPRRPVPDVTFADRMRAACWPFPFRWDREGE